MTYTGFKAEWMGRRIDYDHVYGYQCVDLIKEYAKEVYGIPTGLHGNAIDYWRATPAALLAHFYKVPGSVAHQGDIVVISPNHIGICDGLSATTITILEQNGSTGNGSGVGPDAIRLRAVPRTRVAGLLRPKSIPQPPAPAPTTGTAKVLRECNVRAAPNTSAALTGSRTLHAGDTFQYNAKVAGQAVNGNNIWYRSVYGHYVWSGNCSG